MIESFQHKRNVSVKNKASLPLLEGSNEILIIRWSRTHGVYLSFLCPAATPCILYSTADQYTLQQPSVTRWWCVLWAISRMKRTTHCLQGFLRKKPLQVCHLIVTLNTHSQLSVTNLLMQATPLRVLWGISAQWRALQEQSKCSLTHIGISLENKQICSYPPYLQDD